MSFPRYERYKNAGTGWLSEVPAHWQVIPNKALLRATNDLVGTNSSAFTLLSLTLFGVIVRDIESGRGKFPAEFDSYKAVEAKDLIFCLFDLDETPRTIGLANQPGMITGAYEVLRCKPLGLPSYVFYFYLHVDEFKGLRPWYTGLRKVVRPDTFMSIELALPPLDEQEAIVFFLDNETAKIDRLIEEQRRLIELLKEKRQAVISHAVTKGLDPDAPMKDSGVEWLGQVPTHWSIMSVRRVATKVQTGGTPSSEPSTEDLEGGVPWLTPGDFGDSIRLSGSSKRISQMVVSSGEAKVFPENSVLIVSIGATLGKVGYINFESSANQQINAVVPNSRIDGYFLAYSLSAKSEVMRFLSNASTIGIMNQEKTKEVCLAIPPLKEQPAITDFLDRESSKLDVLTAEAAHAIDLLEERRTALISAAVTGKIDVRSYTPKEVA